MIGNHFIIAQQYQLRPLLQYMQQYAAAIVKHNSDLLRARRRICRLAGTAVSMAPIIGEAIQLILGEFSRRGGYAPGAIHTRELVSRQIKTGGRLVVGEQQMVKKIIGRHGGGSAVAR